jgi:hypothetical protein
MHEGFIVQRGQIASSLSRLTAQPGLSTTSTMSPLGLRTAQQPKQSQPLGVCSPHVNTHDALTSQLAQADAPGPLGVSPVKQLSW